MIEVMNKLEKMKMIYDQTGIEPDLWYSNGIMTYNTIDFDMLDFSPEESIPYYTESRLSEMLPKRIEKFELLIEYENNQCFISYSFCRSHQDELCYEVLRELMSHSDSLHEALLDVFLLCFKKGYLVYASKDVRNLV